MKKVLFVVAIAALMVAGLTAQVVINEVDADQTGTDSQEFAELYNTGVASVDLSAGGYVLVLYNGSTDVSYNAIDLTGTIAAGGFYVIGSATVPNVDQVQFTTDGIQNGQDAVALYSGELATNFPTGTAATSTNIVDAIVYGTSDPADPTLATALGITTPGTILDENANASGVTDSSQRYPDGAGNPLDLDNGWVIDTASPGALNIPVELSIFTTN